MNELTTDTRSQWTNRDLIIPYVAPYFAYVGIASFFHNKIPIEVNYGLKLVLVTALLVWAWRWYLPLTGPKNRWVSCGYGVVFGLVGLVLWIFIYGPFAGTGGDAWSYSGFFLRLVTASLVVPVFEELLMRGFVFRAALQWDEFRKQKIRNPFVHTLERASIFTVPPGAWSVPAILISSVVFALGHTLQEWPAAVVYGILMATLWIIRKDLLSCMIAHGITNLGLALYIFYTGHWGLW